MELITGRKDAALKVVLYGPEGIGKSTFASMFPRPVFEDTEGSTERMDVVRAPRARSFAELKQHAQHFIQHPEKLGTYVVDTMDWAERLATEELLASRQVRGIEDLGYGKGYVYLAEEMGRYLDLLTALKDRGVNIVLNCHAMMRKFEQPDEMGAYDRWELKLSKKVAPLVKEWADMLLFANYKTIVVNVDGQGATKGKNKATGGMRVMYASHHPCWDAKNRFGLPDEMPFDYGQIAHLVRDLSARHEEQSSSAAPGPSVLSELMKAVPPVQEAAPGIPEALTSLMAANAVQPAEIQAVVARKGYFPADMPIGDYPEDFVRGVLIAAWPQVEAAVLEARAEPVPF
ncbi:MAG: ATP-binding protein [Aristaeellaceae bacterium]